MNDDQLAALKYAIGQNVYTFANEAQLQELLQQSLLSAGYAVRREVRLTLADRIDFVVERVGIEVKINDSPAQVARQVRRYLTSDLIDQVMLVTTRALHLKVPAMVDGPVDVIWLARLT